MSRLGVYDEVGLVYVGILGVAMVAFCRRVARFFLNNQSGIRFESWFRPRSENSLYRRLVVITVVCGLAAITVSTVLLVAPPAR